MSHRKKMHFRVGKANYIGNAATPCGTACGCSLHPIHSTPIAAEVTCSRCRNTDVWIEAINKAYGKG